MMRSLPFLLLATLAVFPVAQADPSLDPLTLVRDCLESKDPKYCAAEVKAYAQSLCTAGTNGCFVCADFIPLDGEVDPTRLVEANTFGTFSVRWYGYFYYGSHDPLMPGMWELRSGKSEGIMCSADMGSG